MKFFGFYTLLVIIPLIIVTISTTVHINQELKQIKIDFAAEMKNATMTSKGEFSKLENALKTVNTTGWAKSQVLFFSQKQLGMFYPIVWFQ